MNIIKPIIKNYLKLRSLTYAVESYPIFTIQNFINNKANRQKLTKEDFLFLKKEVETLFDKDAQGFINKDYPIDLLKPKKGFKHFRNYSDILLDSVFVSLRKKNKKNKSFSNKTKTTLDKYPDYFQQNFHNQTDGYLSKDSAKRYEHQVEILFKGTANPMRRRLLSLVKKHLNKEPLENALELACGVGSATEAVAAIAKNLYCIDLSESYLKQAQIYLKKYNNINFLQGKAEDLLFKDASFDFVFSVFLHHELPKEVRKKTFQEAFRVLKKGGLYAFADSIQLNDTKPLEWAIIDFPKNFHEPFYTNYIKSPIEDMIKSAGFEIFERDLSFLTKTIIAKKL